MRSRLLAVLLAPLMLGALLLAGSAHHSPQHTAEQINAWCATHDTAPCRAWWSYHPPYGVGGQWRQVFADEFYGTTLDRTKWAPSWFGTVDGYSRPVNSLEDGCYDTRLVTVADGRLSLASATNRDADCRRRDGSVAPYRGSIVSSEGLYDTTFGYFEAKLRLDGADGDIYNWPAWWLNGVGNLCSGCWPAGGEIDVMEALSSHRPCWHYHYEDSAGRHQGPGGCVDMDGTGWHVYGARWAPGRIDWFYDGRLVGTITEGVVDDPQWLILGNQINQDYGVHVPTTMQVEYVRVWKLA